MTMQGHFGNRLTPIGSGNKRQKRGNWFYQYNPGLSVAD